MNTDAPKFTNCNLSVKPIVTEYTSYDQADKHNISIIPLLTLKTSSFMHPVIIY